MTVTDARKWLILASLIVTGVQIIFLLVAPSVGVPLEFGQSLNLLQIVTPVFLGYLGSAAHFTFMTPPPVVPADNDLLGYLVKGPIVIYAAAMVAAFGTFTYANRPGAPVGTGMSVDDLSTAVSICLGILAAVTGIMVTYLFAVQNQKQAEAEAKKREEEEAEAKKKAAEAAAKKKEAEASNADPAGGAQPAPPQTT